MILNVLLLLILFVVPFSSSVQSDASNFILAPIIERVQGSPAIAAPELVVRKRIPELKLDAAPEPQLTAAAVSVYDPRTKTMVWEREATVGRTMASITKLASIMVVLDRNPDLEAVVPITKQVYESLGNNHLWVSEKIKIKDLLAASLIPSDNTAINALVSASGLSEPEFVAAMNVKAAALGLMNTHFFDPTGLDTMNVSTAADITKLAATAFQYPLIQSLSSQATYAFTAETGKAHLLKSTNQLIGSELNVIAGKTGFVNESGYNLVVDVARDSRELIVTVLGSTSSDARFVDARNIANWVFANYTWP